VISLRSPRRLYFWEKKICQIWKWIRWPTARLQAWITALFWKNSCSTSDNSKHGLKSALKDYEAVFHSGAPKWLDLVWPSIGVSLLHLALSFKQPLPENVDLPQEALKNGLR